MTIIDRTNTGQPDLGTPAPDRRERTPAPATVHLTIDGLPVAVQLVGRTDDEATLFSLSAQIEQARPWPLLAGDA